MSGRLPQSVHPGRLAESGATLRGSMPLVAMSRLRESLHDTEGEVEVELTFGIDAQKLRFIQGTLTATLQLICQRCLQAFEYPMRVGIELGLASSESAAEILPGHYEPVVVEEGRLELGKLVEDELLLALPTVPMHATEDCGCTGEWIEPPAAAPDDRQERRRPFADLGKLLGQKERN